MGLRGMAGQARHDVLRLGLQLKSIVRAQEIACPSGRRASFLAMKPWAAASKTHYLTISPPKN